MGYVNEDSVELIGELWEDNPDKQAVAFDIDDRIVWIPRSIIEDMYEHEDGDPLWYVIVPEWFAEQEGLI